MSERPAYTPAPWGPVAFVPADPADPDRPTLRDQFAMAALTGLLAHGFAGRSAPATEAYAIADAMMKARK